ncbi:hypothetical protein HU200_050410 [Digitaria exilis]|uniref:Uncharacterized protein n=1 Tax=Digitaria exilis TaxID=1010633 RepID=A0A835ARL3_9POAL|nr:hypothetical protein HU200_050410 [Digitaria exilis]
MKRIALEEVEPSAGKKRKVIKTIVPRGLIEIMILYAHKPFYGFPEETLPIAHRNSATSMPGGRLSLTRSWSMSKPSSSSSAQRAMRRTTTRSRSLTTITSPGSK